MTAVQLVLLLLTTARLTRLVTTDVLLEGTRNRLVAALLEHDQDRPPTLLRGKLAYLVVCDWCASFYVGAVVAGAWWAWGDTMWLMMLYAALSASYATGFLATKTEG